MHLAGIQLLRLHLRLFSRRDISYEDAISRAYPNGAAWQSNLGTNRA
jgi:hypothetical protein